MKNREFSLICGALALSLASYATLSNLHAEDEPAFGMPGSFCDLTPATYETAPTAKSLMSFQMIGETDAGVKYRRGSPEFIKLQARTREKAIQSLTFHMESLSKFRPAVSYNPIKDSLNSRAGTPEGFVYIGVCTGSLMIIKRSDLPLYTCEMFVASSVPLSVEEAEKRKCKLLSDSCRLKAVTPEQVDFVNSMSLKLGCY